MEAIFSSHRGRLMTVVVIAIAMSGCDAAGPRETPESANMEDTPIVSRDGGVVLSKSAAIELADFITAVQFDADFPISSRIKAQQIMPMLHF